MKSQTPLGEVTPLRRPGLDFYPLIQKPRCSARAKHAIDKELFIQTRMLKYNKRAAAKPASDKEMFIQTRKLQNT
jgi:hypothetical protein